MSRRHKIFIPNNTYFITFTIFGWRKLFINDKYCALVYKWFDYVKEKYGNLLYSYVIMPNHIHCLMFVTDKSPRLSTLVMNAKRFLAYGIVNLLKKEKDRQEQLNFFVANARTADRAKHRIFTDRYDSLIIQSQKFFLEKLNYIHNNPLQESWQLAQNPEDYKYSSASNYILGSGFHEVTIME